MLAFLAVLIYVIALALPVYLLYFYRARAWYWHVLAVAAALAIGMVPTPPELKSTGFDLLFGFAAIFLLVWGIGGLLLPHRHRERHA